MGLEELAPYLQETLANDLVYSDDEMVDILQEALSDLRKAKLDPAPPATKEEFPKITPGSVFERGSSLTASKRAKMQARDRKNSVEVPIGRPESPPPEREKSSVKNVHGTNAKHVSSSNSEKRPSEGGMSLSPGVVQTVDSKRLSEYENLVQANAKYKPHSPDTVREHDNHPSRSEHHPSRGYHPHKEVHAYDQSRLNEQPHFNEQPHSNDQPRSNDKPRSNDQHHFVNDSHKENRSQISPHTSSEPRSHNDSHHHHHERDDRLSGRVNGSRHQVTVSHISQDRKFKSGGTTFYVDTETSLSPVESDMPPQESRGGRKDPRLDLAYRRAQNNSIWLRGSHSANGEVEFVYPGSTDDSNRVGSPSYSESHNRRGSSTPEHQSRGPPPYQTTKLNSPQYGREYRVPESPVFDHSQEARPGSGHRIHNDHDAFNDPRRRQPPPYPGDRHAAAVRNDGLVSIQALKQPARQRTLPKGVLVAGQVEYDITEL